MNIEELKQKSLSNHIPIIMDDTLEVIEKILLEENPKRILELGTATGYSSICFAQILLDNCRGRNTVSARINRHHRIRRTKSK